MILEVEQLTDRVVEVFLEGLARAAVQIPEDGIVTTVVPFYADGDLMCVEGVIDVRALAREVVDEIGRDR